MTHPAGRSPAWAAILPANHEWLPGPHRWAAARRIRRALAGLAADSSLAAAGPPWAVLRTHDTSRPAVRRYIALPSAQNPLLIASEDRAARRYVAEFVLSVPPGAGPLPSLVLTAGLRLLRLRPAWLLAAVLRAGGVVVVGRR